MNNLVMWKCKDGREIAVRDMSDDHLVNTIRHNWRRAEKLASKDDNIMGAVDIMEFVSSEPEWFLPVQHSAMEAVAKARGLRF